jgi:hypothetical protein
MSEADKVRPNAPSQTVTEAKVCPNCSRKLLTQTSALCNWCGARIDDPEYQMNAAQVRQAQDQTQKARVEESQREKPKFGLFGRFVTKPAPKPKGKNELEP